MIAMSFISIVRTYLPLYFIYMYTNCYITELMFGTMNMKHKKDTAEMFRYFISCIYEQIYTKDV